MTKTTSKRAVAAGLTAGLLGGAAAGMVFGIPGVTSAVAPAVVQQSDDETDTTEATDDSALDETANEDWAAEAVERLREALQPLVDDDTLNSGQADDVADFLVEEREGRMGKAGQRGHGPGRGGMGGSFGRSDVIQETLRLEATEIREALSDGGSLADLATANGVDPKVLIDALVAESQARIDEAIADGRLSEDDATEHQADMVERITDMVNGEMPERGDFGGRGRHGGPFGSDDSSTDEEG